MNIRSILSTILFSLTALFAQAQKIDTTYFDANWKPSTKAESSFYRVTTVVQEGVKYEFSDYYNNGKLQMTGSFSSLNPEVKDGVFTWYDDNGEKAQEAVFEKGRVKSKTNFAPSPDSKNPSPEYVSLEKQPQYPGGMKALYKYIGNHFNYPKGLKPRPKGIIPVSFVIDKDGSITEVYVKEPLHPLLDAEAIRVVENMAKWEPGIQDGKPVRVVYTIPISVE